MERLGRGKEYRTIIETEISKVREISDQQQRPLGSMLIGLDLISHFYALTPAKAASSLVRGLGSEVSVLKGSSEKTYGN